MKSVSLCAMAVLAAVAAAVGAIQIETPRRAPVPTDAIEGILAAFESHTIVALPDAHGSQQLHGFLLSLIRDPRFRKIVDDIVVEFGNARYQGLVDRFVQAETVPFESVRLAWRNHTQPSLSADLLHHEEFFRAVRAVNASVRDRKLRVVLGDPPIDWDAIRDRADHFKWVQMRDAHPAATVQTEVIAKQRRALVVYGVAHLQRKNVLSNFEMNDWRAQTLVSLIERSGPTKVFTIVGLPHELAQEHASKWPTPGVAIIRGTTLGAIDASRYFGSGGRFAIADGKMTPVTREQWRTLAAEDQFDGVFHLGPPSKSDREPLSRDLCTERGYVDMRLKRITVTGLPPFETERLKTLCAGDPRR